MRILSIKILETSSYSIRTAALTVLTQDGKELIIHVETKDGLYREEMGCTVYSVSKGLSGLSRVEIREEDFNNYDSNIRDVIKKAEKYVLRSYEKAIPRYAFNSGIPFKPRLKEYTKAFMVKLVALFLFACAVLAAEYTLVVAPFAVLEHIYGKQGFFSISITVLWGIVVFVEVTLRLIKAEFLEFWERQLAP